MKTYLAGTPVKLEIEFKDADGNDLEVVKAKYRVIDQDSLEVQASKDFDLYGEMTIEVPADVNVVKPINLGLITSENMADFSVYEIRVVEIDATLDDGNVHPFTYAYAIAPRDPLIAGLNSFQTMTQAYLNALTIPDLSSWMLATDQERAIAMVEARVRICSLRFSDMTLGQSYLSESQDIGELSLIPPSDFGSLSIRFRKALCKAQIAEAEAILGGVDSSTMNRMNGLLSQTIGETHETYGRGKVLDMQVSKQAMRYLGEFISYSKKVGRA